MERIKFKVNTDRLGRDTELVSQQIEKMEKALENMQADVSRLHAMWDGPGKQAFVRAFAEDMQAASAIIAELRSLRNAEFESKNAYENAEKQATGLVDGIKV